MSDDFHTLQLMEGISAFQSARLFAFWEEVLALARGKRAELLNFEEIRGRLHLHEQRYTGLQEVRLNQIVGSVGRYNEFTGTWLPKRNEMRARWSQTYAQASGLMGLPPIELYRVGDLYFVRDGNHRVSVARQLGAKTIQAYVTELPSSISLHPKLAERELDELTA